MIFRQQQKFSGSQQRQLPLNNYASRSLDRGARYTLAAVDKLFVRVNTIPIDSQDFI